MQPFDSLRRRMIEHGYAPRYAQRLAQELDDHFHDAYRQARDEGATPEDAAQIAMRRVGDEEVIFQGLHASGCRRALVRRWPMLFFVVAPLLVMAVVAFALALLVAIVAIALPIDNSGRMPLATFFATRVLIPVAATAMAMCWILLAHHYQSPLRWPFVASCGFALLTGTFGVHILPPEAPGSIAFAIGVPPQNWLMVMPLLVFGVYMAGRRRADRRLAVIHPN